LKDRVKRFHLHNSQVMPDSIAAEQAPVTALDTADRVDHRQHLHNRQFVVDRQGHTSAYTLPPTRKQQSIAFDVSEQDRCLARSSQHSDPFVRRSPLSSRSQGSQSAPFRLPETRRECNVSTTNSHNDTHSEDENEDMTFSCFRVQRDRGTITEGESETQHDRFLLNELMNL
jgi:hypothetical protein